ncbi:hypothetical protein A3A55_01685 [Candidatus Roizmanbacteria bacterium RIFCSPLOWO2_01_FULL_40_14]|nr:MAG: hypothetical protein A3A55_01685 [Candidatus Roizmanbacteria bacterium RIFCSPLOWO2_01_FULL_40_14]
MAKRSTVIIIVGFLVGLVVSIVAIALFQSRQLQNEITVQRRHIEVNQLIKNRGAKLSFGDSQTVSIDEEFTIPVVLTSEEFHVNGADIEISYDPQFLKIVLIENGEIFDHFVADEINEKEQKLLFSVAMDPDKMGFTGSATIATIMARALRPGTTALEYIYHKNDRNDSNVSVSDLPGEDVLEMAESLQITVQ